LRAIKEPLRGPERAPWESLENLPGSPQKRGLEGPLRRPRKGTKRGARKAIILNSRGPGWAWNTIILGVSKPTQKCPEGRVWLGAQALKSGPGTLEKPRFWRGTQGHPSTQGSLPSA